MFEGSENTIAVDREGEQQLEFAKQKLEMKLEYEKKSEELKKGKSRDSGNAQAKLPKLSITKFDGSFENWLSFQRFTLDNKVRLLKGSY